VLALAFTLLLWQQDWDAAMALLVGFILSQLLPTLPLLKSFWQGIWPPRFSRTELGEILRYGLPLAPAAALSTLSNNADRLLLPLFVSTSAVGLYGPAYSLARQTVPVLMQSVNLAAFPLAIRALEKSEAEARQQLADNFTLLLLIGLPAAVGLAVLAPAIAHTVLGPAYAPTGASLLPLLALGWFLHSLRSYYTEQAFQLAKNTRPGMWITLISATVSLSLSAVCLHLYGLAGAAYGAVMGAAIALLLSWVAGRRVFPLPFHTQQVLLVTGAALSMALVLWPQRESMGFLPLGLAIASGGGIYGALILAGNVLNLRHKLMRRE
jgi:O-antigen/teichoic acid export membrane protein